MKHKVIESQKDRYVYRLNGLYFLLKNIYNQVIRDYCWNISEVDIDLKTGEIYMSDLISWRATKSEAIKEMYLHLHLNIPNRGLV